MAIVAGVDFGTLSVRVTLLDSVRGRLGTASAEYPLARKRDDPDYATQSHARPDAGSGSRNAAAFWKKTMSTEHDVAAIALDTTGSSVIPVDAAMQPLDDYYLWCDHRAHEEAREITELALRRRPRGDPLVRRRLLARVGFRQAAALAAAQSGEAANGLRLRSNTATWSPRR